MAEGYEIDLTYVTERVIAVSFPRACSEETYLHNLREVTHMLQSKHTHNYLVLNLSEHSDDLSRMNPRVLDAGWRELHTPALDKLCSVCRSMENWLNTHTQHVVVLHCRGDRGRVGVVVSSYIHLTRAEQDLDLFAMKRFYDDKMANLMTPSQKRYVCMLGGLLAGQVRMNSSPLFLLCVTLHGIPNLDSTGVCRLFVRVYQNMEAVCTSGVHQVAVGQTDRVCFELEPPQLLKGDIMIVCYHKSVSTRSRQLLLRVQFHTGTLHTHTLTFQKEDLDHANTDPRFPQHGSVDVLFSEGPEKIPGCDGWRNSSVVAVDYDTMDPLIRWDSYEIVRTEVPLAEGPALGCLSISTNPAPSYHAPITGSPSPCEPAHSVSSDSGLSLSPHWLQRGPHRGPSPTHTHTHTHNTPHRGPSPEEHAQLQKLLRGVGLQGERHPLEIRMTELTALGEGPETEEEEPQQHSSPTSVYVNGEAMSQERETDILDDEVSPAPAKDTMSSEDPPPSSSLGGVESNQNFIQSDGLGAQGSHASVSEHTSFNQGVSSTHTLTHILTDTPIHTLTHTPTNSSCSQGGYPTHTWVRHQQLVSAHPYPYTPPESCQSSELDSTHLSEPAAVSDPPPGEARPGEAEEEEELDADMDQSIEQLNQLILDLDPTFQPVPTRARGHMTHSTSLYTNGLSQRDGPSCTHQSGWKHRQASDVTDYPAFQSPGCDLLQTFQNSPIYTPNLPPSQRAVLYSSDCVDYGDHTPEMHSPLWAGSDMAPPTPTFPVSPPTPYVKSASAFSHLRLSSQSSGQYETFRTQNESRSYLDGMAHTPVSSDGDLFRTDVPTSSASCQRMFGSLRSVSTPSPLPTADSLTPPRPSPPLSLSSPAAHSSPRGSPRDLGLALGNGGLELNLLEAVEGLEGLGLAGAPPPLLPHKRRGGEPGLTSPLNGSSLSRPFPSSLSERGVSTPSPDLLASKQDTVKFVQDTSKFWYKPEISREQAIAVLKDRDPGSFIVRDSHSFRGAYGLAMKVATPPPTVLQQSRKVGDLSSELVRHFLIECTQKGVRLKGCPNEPYFGSLTALVCQHSIMPLALPCKLIIPDRDPLEESSESVSATASNSAAELLKQGAACNVWFLGSVELESLTGVQAVQKAATVTLSLEPPPTSTIVHFKVSAQGITLTDNQRKLFFRRHYAVNTVIFCALDPQDRKWTKDGCSSAKIFGFVARKTGCSTENVCHLFAEHDPEQPASAIVNFVSKVMIGSQKTK